MALVTPADAKGPVPVMIMFGGGVLPARPRRCRRRGPRRRAAARRAGAIPRHRATDRGGLGLRLAEPGSVQADNGAGLTKGIIGLVNKGQPRKPDDWGALRAWAWGASRGARLP